MRISSASDTSKAEISEFMACMRAEDMRGALVLLSLYSTSETPRKGALEFLGNLRGDTIPIIRGPAVPGNENGDGGWIPSPLVLPASLGVPVLPEGEGNPYINRARARNI